MRNQRQARGFEPALAKPPRPDPSSGVCSVAPRRASGELTAVGDAPRRPVGARQADLSQRFAAARAKASFPAQKASRDGHGLRAALRAEQVMEADGDVAGDDRAAPAGPPPSRADGAQSPRAARAPAPGSIADLFAPVCGGRWERGQSEKPACRGLC
eukprot:2757993-Alexandrium_andersonii.AAC.1